MNSVLLFLSELQENNNKIWMDEHRKWYEQSKESFIQLVDTILKGLQQVDEGLQGLEAKDCIFRLNRDVRFSKNKAPYKNNFAAYIAEGGKKSNAAGYYIHIQPDGESMLGGGIYNPPSEELSKIRQEVDYNPEGLRNIFASQKFRDLFGAIQGEKLAKAPKGYPSDHPYIEVLKLKSFFVFHKLTDDEVKSSEFPENALNILKEIAPLNEYLNVAIS
jgi:uncharacterized protein (TIGR02453 family)